MAVNNDFLLQCKDKTISSIEDIIDSLSCHSGIRGIIGLMLSGITKSYGSSVEDEKLPSKAVTRMVEFINSTMIPALNPSRERTHERYRNYINPIFMSGVCNRWADNSELLSDKLTSYDIASIMDLICEDASKEVYEFLKINHQKIVKLMKDEKFSSIVNTQNPEEIASMNDNDRCIRKYANQILEIVKAIKENFDFNKSINFNECGIFNGSIHSCLNRIFNGQFNPDDVEFEYLYLVLDTDLLCLAYLTGVLKNVFGKELFIDENFKTNKVFTLPKEEFVSLISIISLFCFLAEFISTTDVELYSESPDSRDSIISRNLNTSKEIFLKVIPNIVCEDGTDSKNFLNLVYDTLCKSDMFGKRKLSYGLLNTRDYSCHRGSSDVDAYSLMVPDVLNEESLDKFIESVKSERSSEKGEYFDFISLDVSFNHPRTVVELFSKNLEKDSLFEIYSAACDEFNSNKLNSIFVDKSEFGLACAISSLKIDNVKISHIQRVVGSIISRCLMLLMTNVHISDERNTNWTPNMITLLNLYISFISSGIYRLITEDVVEGRTLYGYKNSLLINILNLGNKLNYRNSRLPNFKYKKEGTIIPHHFKSWDSFSVDISVDIYEICRRVQEYNEYSTKDALFNGVVKYIADGILNNTMNAEYAFIILNEMMSSKYERIFGRDSDGMSRTPISNVIKYILTHIGDKDGEFFGAFDEPEENYSEFVYDEYTMVDIKDRISKLEGNLESYIFISIAQRILMMNNFSDKVKAICECSKTSNTAELGSSSSSIQFGIFSNHPERYFENYNTSYKEKYIMKDIENAMNIFDTTLNETHKNYNWFEEHKDLIVGKNNGGMKNA